MAAKTSGRGDWRKQVVHPFAWLKAWPGGIFEDAVIRNWVRVASGHDLRFKVARGLHGRETEGAAREATD